MYGAEHMNLKYRCIILLVGLGFFAAAARGDNPKTHRVTLSTAVQIGGVEFQPGVYRLTVDSHDPNVLFQAEKTGKETLLEAKVETGPEKYQHTAIHSKHDGDTRRVVQIRLGGTNTAVTFE
jgi:hypothetical protein